MDFDRILRFITDNVTWLIFLVFALSGMLGKGDKGKRQQSTVKPQRRPTPTVNQRPSTYSSDDRNRQRESGQDTFGSPFDFGTGSSLFEDDEETRSSNSQFGFEKTEWGSTFDDNQKEWTSAFGDVKDDHPTIEIDGKKIKV